MNILLVTGMSGAGKSNALRVLEDMGYLCVDNLPGGLIDSFVELCLNTEPQVEKAAVVIDSRTNVFRLGIEKILDTLERLEPPHEVLFLDCSNEVLLRRYGETRRRHPMHDDVSAGIMMERELLQPIKERANYVIDTTELSTRDCQRLIGATIGGGSAPAFRLVITSFGYKRGVPLNADIVIDMRYTANPYYEESLRSLSGRDKPVRSYVMSDPLVISELERLTSSLKELIPAYQREGKRRLMVAFGCTGGRHRSVAMAEALFENMRDFCDTTIEHRDLLIEADEISERYGK